MKHCTKCLKEKNEVDFYLDRGRLRSVCKTCHIVKATVKYWENPQNKINKQKQKYLLDPSSAKASSKKWRLNNLESDRANKKAYHDRQMKADPIYKLKHSIRIRLKKAIKYNHKGGSAIKNLGCSVEELKKHIESQFKPGMTWSNWGLFGWHIDHKIPLSNFDLTKDEELKTVCHYTNLQPLWWQDNLHKGNNYGS